MHLSLDLRGKFSNGESIIVGFFAHFSPGTKSFLGTPTQFLATPPDILEHHTLCPRRVPHSELHGGNFLFRASSSAALFSLLSLKKNLSIRSLQFIALYILL